MTNTVQGRINIPNPKDNLCCRDKNFSPKNQSALSDSNKINCFIKKTFLVKV